MDFTNIFDASKEGTIDDVKIFIEEQYVDVNLKDEYKNTPLIYATGWNNKNSELVTSYLVSHGADVNAKNDLGDTPMHMAADKDNVRTV